MPNITVSPRALESIVARRGRLERSIVRHLLRNLKVAGYLPSEVWDGETYVRAETQRAVLNAVFSVDNSTIHFGRGQETTDFGHGVAIVLGNGADCISDWHVSDAEFDAVVGRVSDWTTSLEDS